MWIFIIGKYNFTYKNQVILRHEIKYNKYYSWFMYIWLHVT